MVMTQDSRQAKKLTTGNKKLAARIRKAMTVGLPDETELIETGMVILLSRRLSVGEIPTDKDMVSSDDYDPDGKGHRWTLSLEGVLAMHLYEARWFHSWQRARARRN